MTEGPDGRVGYDVTEAAARLALIDEASELSRRHIEPKLHRLHMAWGVTWMLGYGSLYLGASERRLAWLSAALFTGCCLVGLVAGVVVVSAAGRHVRGPARRQAGGVAASWLAGCVLAVVLTVRSVEVATTPGVSDAAAGFLLSSVPNAAFCLCIALTYCTVALLLRYRSFAVVGALILLAATVGLLVPVPTMFLVMAALGGGGQLVVGCLLLGRWRRRH